MSTLSYENPLQFVSITLNVIFPRSECRENTRNEFNRTIERLRSAFFLSFLKQYKNIFEQEFDSLAQFFYNYFGYGSTFDGFPALSLCLYDI